MNRITRCLHGSGTVREVLQSENTTGKTERKNLAFSGSNRPVIFWNITKKCNLSCIHCYNSSGRAHINELSTAEALGVIDDLAETGVPLIIFSGGEPLLRNDLMLLAEHARKRGIMTALSSNGTLIDAKTASKIKRAGIEYAGISIDGAKPQTHNRFRGSPDAFERTTRAFGHCLDAGLRCGVRVTLTKDNFEELNDIIDLALSLGAVRFCLYWLVPSGRGGDDYKRLQLDCSEVLKALNIIYRRAKKISPSDMEFLTVDAPQDAVHLLCSMKKDHPEEFADALKLVSSLNGGCSAGSRVAGISHEGFVYPCQFAQSGDFFVGDVRKKPFSMIWNDDSNPVLSLFRGKETELTGKCKNCSHLGLCGGGCRIRAYYSQKDFFADDPFCFIDENGFMGD